MGSEIFRTLRSKKEVYQEVLDMEAQGEGTVAAGRWGRTGPIGAQHATRGIYLDWKNNLDYRTFTRPETSN